MGRLHQFFKTEERRTFFDGQATQEVVFRSLTSHEESEVRRRVEAARREAKRDLDTPVLRADLLRLRSQQASTTIIEEIVAEDRSVITSLADLAPNGDDSISEEDRKAREEEATTKADAHRRQGLADLEREGLLAMAVDRDVERLVTAEANQAAFDATLCYMLVDPDTREPMLSMEPKSPDWIGYLATEMRQALIPAWIEINTARAQKRQRVLATNPTSSPRGVSDAVSDASPGETATISSNSPTLS